MKTGFEATGWMYLGLRRHDVLIYTIFQRRETHLQIHNIELQFKYRFWYILDIFSQSGS